MGDTSNSSDKKRHVFGGPKIEKIVSLVFYRLEDSIEFRKFGVHASPEPSDRGPVFSIFVSPGLFSLGHSFSLYQL
jgi:hypothetical protein